MFYRGRLLKRIEMQGSECVEIIHRPDGMFQFLYRKPCNDNINYTPTFESGTFISAETAEAAARQKFKLA